MTTEMVLQRVQTLRVNTRLEIRDPVEKLFEIWERSPHYSIPVGPETIEFVVCDPRYLHAVDDQEHYGVYFGRMIFVSTATPQQWIPFVALHEWAERKVGGSYETGEDPTGKAKHWQAIYGEIRIAALTMSEEEFKAYLIWRASVERTQYFTLDGEAKDALDTFTAKKALTVRLTTWERRALTLASMADLLGYDLAREMGASHTHLLLSRIVNTTDLDFAAAHQVMAALAYIPVGISVLLPKTRELSRAIWFFAGEIERPIIADLGESGENLVIRHLNGCTKKTVQALLGRMASLQVRAVEKVNKKNENGGSVEANRSGKKFVAFFTPGELAVFFALGFSSRKIEGGGTEITFCERPSEKESVVHFEGLAGEHSTTVEAVQEALVRFEDHRHLVRKDGAVDGCVIYTVLFLDEEVEDVELKQERPHGKAKETACPAGYVFDHKKGNTYFYKRESDGVVLPALAGFEHVEWQEVSRPTAAGLKPIGVRWRIYMTAFEAVTFIECLKRNGSGGAEKDAAMAMLFEALGGKGCSVELFKNFPQLEVGKRWTFVESEAWGCEFCAVDEKEKGRKRVVHVHQVYQVSDKNHWRKDLESIAATAPPANAAPGTDEDLPPDADDVLKGRPTAPPENLRIPEGHRLVAASPDDQVIVLHPGDILVFGPATPPPPTAVKELTDDGLQREITAMAALLEVVSARIVELRADEKRRIRERAEAKLREAEAEAARLERARQEAARIVEELKREVEALQG